MKSYRYLNHNTIIYTFIIVITALITSLFTTMLLHKLHNKGMNSPIYIEIENNKELLNKDLIYQMIRSYILENPQLIVESIELMQKNKIKDSEEKIKSKMARYKELFEKLELMPTIGNPKGDITITVIYDYNCNYCKKANVLFNYLLENDKNLRIVYIPLPVMGVNSNYLFKFMMSLYHIDRIKFKDMHDKLMNLNSSPTPEIMNNALDALKISKQDVENNMEDPEVVKSCSKAIYIGEYIQLSAVPMIIINDNPIKPSDLPKIQEIIDEIRRTQKSHR